MPLILAKDSAVLGIPEDGRPVVSPGEHVSAIGTEGHRMDIAEVPGLHDEFRRRGLGRLSRGNCPPNHHCQPDAGSHSASFLRTIVQVPVSPPILLAA